MDEISSQSDIETLINDRHTRHNRLMKDLDGVMEVLLSFCEQAEWMMDHEYRIGELIGEVVVASTEVEHVLPRTEQYFKESQRMLLPAVERQKPKDFDKAMSKIKGVLPRLKPYCDSIIEDESGLDKFRQGEVEPTCNFNNNFIENHEVVIENFSAFVGKMERNINGSYNKHLSLSDDVVRIQFDTMYMQYYTGKEDEIKEYIDEIENADSARSEMITVHNTLDIFNCYYRNEKHPEVLIRELNSHNKKENCLLTIFYFKSRLEALKHYDEIKRKGSTGDEEQPVNLVFKKYHDGRALDFFTIRKYLEVKLVKNIKRKYEWYSAYRIFDDLKLLEELTLTSFAEQMNTWFPDAKVECADDALGDYATGHTSKNFNLWNEITFLAEKKNNQTKSGFRKLYNHCNDLKDALKTIPTLNPRP